MTTTSAAAPIAQVGLAIQDGTLTASITVPVGHDAEGAALAAWMVSHAEENVTSTVTLEAALADLIGEYGGGLDVATVLAATKGDPEAARLVGEWPWEDGNDSNLVADYALTLDAVDVAAIAPF